jgi:hypothetical protein
MPGFDDLGALRVPGVADVTRLFCRQPANAAADCLISVRREAIRLAGDVLFLPAVDWEADGNYPCTLP